MFGRGPFEDFMTQHASPIEHVCLRNLDILVSDVGRLDRFEVVAMKKRAYPILAEEDSAAIILVTVGQTFPLLPLHQMHVRSNFMGAILSVESNETAYDQQARSLVPNRFYNHEPCSCVIMCSISKNCIHECSASADSSSNMRSLIQSKDHEILNSIIVTLSATHGATTNIRLGHGTNTHIITKKSCPKF